MPNIGTITGDSSANYQGSVLALEQFANNASTSLNGGIDSSVTNLTINSAAWFPASGIFRILIDSEIMLVTQVNSNTFSVIRGAENTLAAAHSDGAAVTHVLTAGAINQFRADTITAGTSASRPTAGVAGRLHMATDNPYIYQDNGSTWPAAWLSLPLNPPDSSWIGYNWTNQGSATITANVNGVTTLYCPPQGSDSLHIWSKNVPAAPYTYTIGITATIWGYILYNKCGLILHDGANKSTGMFMFGDNKTYQTPSIVIDKWNNLTSWSNTYQLTSSGNYIGIPLCGPMLFMRVSDDGVSRKWYVSVDNINYTIVLSTSRTDWITPTKIGLLVNANNGASNADLSMNVFHIVG